ncbi:MAG: hypothetical protein D6771_08950 [Zetaproteobacteria bacterium]|nr:MAG: hypothetical protein D6771_08950 [Zetaproteobacteria bacterium]
MRVEAEVLRREKGRVWLQPVGACGAGCCGRAASRPSAIVVADEGRLAEGMRVWLEVEDRAWLSDAWRVYGAPTLVLVGTGLGLEAAGLSEGVAGALALAAALVMFARGMMRPPKARVRIVSAEEV